MSKTSKRRKTLLDFFSQKNESTSNVNVDEAENVAASEVACNSNENTQNLTKEPDHSRVTDSSMVTVRSSNDISLYVGEIYTNAEKIRMLKNMWIPDRSFNFQFTITSLRNLCFQYRWPICFKYLAYSLKKMGIFANTAYS